MNVYGSNIQIWTQTKRKMHQRINKHRIINLDSNQIKKPKLSTKSALHGIDDKLGETWLDKTQFDGKTIFF